MTSFVAPAAPVAAGQPAAVLPDVASSVLRDPAILRKPLPWDYRRELVILWNQRSLDRAGFAEREIKGLTRALTAKTPAE